ncbi:MAG: hypothetical protein PVH19_14175 [Planctomycetia bacterium]
MNTQSLYDIAQQSPEPISANWFFYVFALFCLLYGILMMKRMRRHGYKKWGLWFGVSMTFVAVWLTGGGLFSHYREKAYLKKYRDWPNSVEYQTVEGECVVPFYDPPLLGDTPPETFQVGNQTFEYGLFSDVNHYVSEELIEPLPESDQPVRVYYEGALILRIESVPKEKPDG